MALREIVIELGLEVDQRDIDKATDAFDSLKKAAFTVGTLFATGVVAVGFNKLVEFGSRAEERINKFGAVFKDSSAAVQTALAKISAETGIANPMLEQFAADIGAILKPALGSAEAAGKMSAGVAGLAFDIASFFDEDPVDAFVKLRSAFVGSAEPLLALGIDTRIAALETEAMRQGITKSFKAMSAGEKTALRYAAIIRSLSESGGLGDAAKTSDSFANASRGLNSQIRFLGEILGSFLVEDAGKTAVTFRKIVGSINAWLIVNDKLIRQNVNLALQVINNTIKGVVIGVGFLIDGFRKLSDFIGPVATGILITVAAIAALVAIMGAPVVAVLALGAAVLAIIDDFVVWSEGGESLFGLLLDGIQKFLGEFVNVGPLFDNLMQSLGSIFDFFFDDTEGSTEGFVTRLVEVMLSAWESGVKLWDATVVEFISRTFDKAKDLWGDITEEWTPKITEFFNLAIEEITKFANIGLEKAKEIFDGLAEVVGKGLKAIFGGVIGRIIIDFLGVKAGAAVGEFMGQIVAKLAGAITGKGFVRKALGSTFAALAPLIGKGVGALAGGLAADELATGLQEFINAPATTGISGGMLSPLSSSSSVNQSNDITVNVDAAGNQNPEGVGRAVGRSVQDAMGGALRQIQQDFLVQGAT